MSDPEYTSLLETWFGSADLKAPPEPALRDAWFMPPPDWDSMLERKFGTWPQRAEAGELDGWRDTPAGALACILVCDQLPRNLYRGSANAYAFDDRALDAAIDVLEAGQEQALGPYQRIFVLLPFEHAESLEMQNRCVEEFERLVTESPGELQDDMATYLPYAESHRDIVRRFGRFPHRNAVLGRDSTPEETAYMEEEGGQSFGQG